MAYSGDIVRVGERVYRACSARWATPIADMVRPIPYPEIYAAPRPEDHHPVPRSHGRCSPGRVEPETAQGDHRPGWARRAPRWRSTQLRVLGGAVRRASRPRRRPTPTATARIMVNVAAIYVSTSSRCGRSTKAWVRGRVAVKRTNGDYRGLRRLPGRRGRGAHPRGLPRGTTYDRLAAVKVALRPGQRLPPQPEPPACARPGQPSCQHSPERLDDDPRAHSTCPALAVAEADRHLADPGAGPHRAVGRLNLEAEAGGVEAARRQVLQQLAPEALEAAGQVLDRHA